MSGTSRHIPSELVEDVLSHLRGSRAFLQSDLSACALVSRTWLDLARWQRYKVFTFDLDRPFNKDGTILQLKPRGFNHQSHRSLENLLKTFDDFPAVPGYIHTFKLHANAFSVWLSEDEIDGRGQPFEPVPDSRKIGVQVEHLLALLRRLTSVRNLHLPDVIADWQTLSQLSAPVFRELNLLRMHQPPNQGDLSLERFSCFMRLFGTVNHMVLENVRIYTNQLESSLKPSSMCLPQLAIKSLKVADQHYNDWSGGLLWMLRDLPSIYLLRSLDLCYVVPEDMSALCALLEKAAPSLEHLTLQLEQPSHHEHKLDLQHYRLLDLKDCHALRVVSFRVWFYHPLELKHLHDASLRTIGGEIVDFLDFFLQFNVPPNLHCLNLKLCSQEADGRDVCFDHAEKVLLQNIRKDRLSMVAITTWWSGAFDDRSWAAFGKLLPGLAEENLLLRFHPLMTSDI